jgi:transposase-like protein
VRENPLLNLIEQMVAIIGEADREPVSAVSKRHGVSEQTIYTWRCSISSSC